MSATQSIIDREQVSLMHTYARLPIVLADGQGCRVRDTDGREYLDLVAGIAVCSLGHRHPALVAALKEAADGLWHVSNLFHTAPHVELAEKLCLRSGMQRAFFCNSGAEANEAAIKLARKLAGPADGPRRGIIAAEGSFHGRTTGALACTGQEKYRAAFGPLLPGVTFVPWGDTVALARAVGPTTAAVILEPVQGEGGLRPAPSGYLEAARQLCDTHGAILIFDEVQTGMGRSGKFFAYQHGGAVPDALTTAKALAGGLPMGALLTRGRAAEGFSPGDHASTFGGGPLVSRVALAMLRELEAPGFLEHVAKVGAKLGDGLAALARELPQLLAGSRGRGMMQGLVFREPVAGEAVNRLRERGYLTLTAGPTVLRLVPPLVLTEAEADDALGAIGAVVRELAGS